MFSTLGRKCEHSGSSRKVFSGKISIMECLMVSFIESEQQDWERNSTVGMTACSRSVQTTPVARVVWCVLCAAGWFFTCAGRAAGCKGVFLIDSNHSAVFFLFRRFLFAARRSVATPAIANFRGPLPLKIHGCYFDRGKGEKRKMILTFHPGGAQCSHKPYGSPLGELLSGCEGERVGFEWVEPSPSCCA